jgi:hypothetical protein
MDDKTLYNLLLPDIASLLLNTLNNNSFWYLRSQILVKKELKSRQINWKEMYYSLCAAITNINRYVYTVNHGNPNTATTITKIFKELKFPTKTARILNLSRGVYKLVISSDPLEHFMASIIIV